MNFFSNVNLNKNQLLNAVLHPAATAPATPSNGQIYYNTGDSKVYISRGSTFTPLSYELSNATGTGIVELLSTYTVKALKAGTGITITDASNVVTITASASASDNILDGSSSGTTITYAPYATDQAANAAPRFYTTTNNPTGTSRLNVSAYFYATKLYSGGTEVSVTSHTHTLAALTDTTITTPAAGHVLQYDSTTSKWLNKTLASAGIQPTVTAGTGLAFLGDTLNHTNSVTAGTVSDGGVTRTLGWGGTFKIPSVTYDAQGHVTTSSTITLTMPANPDTNYYPTTFAWTGGTTAGPTGSLTGVGMSAVSFGAIPVASDTASGVITTGAQTLAGVKTFSSRAAFTVAPGTSPFAVTSTTVVTNLNADLLDGQQGSYYAVATHNHTGTYQPLDGDLTAIAALAGNGGFLKKTAANTWALDTTTVANKIDKVPGFGGYLPEFDASGALVSSGFDSSIFATGGRYAVVKRDTVTLGTAGTAVPFSILNFDKDTDTLLVYQNSLYFLQEGVDYTLNATNNGIVLTTAANVGDLFNFVAFKNVPEDQGLYSGIYITDGSITDAKMATDVKLGSLATWNAATTQNATSILDAVLLAYNSAQAAANIAGGLLGSVPYQSEPSTTVLLNPNITTTKKYFTMTGTGTLGAIPSWETIGWTEIGGRPSSKVADIDNAVSRRHSQNTDVGTSSATFYIGTSGPKIKSSSGEFQLRNNGDTAYADLRVGNLFVTGATTEIAANTVTIGDSTLLLNSDVTTSALNSDGGIEVKRLKTNNTTRADASFIFNNTTGRWDATWGAVASVRTHAVAMKYSVTIGDTTNTSYTINHNLNSQDITVTIRQVASPYEVVYADIECTSADTLTVKFAAIPGANKYRVTVTG